MSLSGLSEKGFTLIELMMVSIISSLLLAGLVKLFDVMQWSFHTQDQINIMTQNANFAVRRLSDILLEIGADLPETGFKAVNLKQGKNDSIQYFINPRGGVQVFLKPVNSKNVPVDSASAFKGATHIFRKSDGKSFAINSVSEVPGLADTVILTSSIQIDAGDTIYAFKSDRIYLKDNNLYQGDDILAESIDSLNFTFVDVNGAITDDWSEMRSASIGVRGCTSTEDRHFKSEHGDGYRRISFALDVRLRNR